MTRIFKGERLEDTIKRVIRDELKIADDFIKAGVFHDIEFDCDKEGILTPRIIVYIYVNKIKDRDRAVQLSQTSWRSLDGSLPK